MKKISNINRKTIWQKKIKSRDLIFNALVVASCIVWGMMHGLIFKIHSFFIQHEDFALVETYSFLQVLGIVLLVAFILNKFGKTWFAVTALFFVYSWYMILELYFILTRTPLDFAFFKIGVADILILIQPYFNLMWLFCFVFIAITCSYFIVTIEKYVLKKSWAIALSIFVVCVFTPQFIGEAYQSKIYTFFQSAIPQGSVPKHYRTLYNQLLETSHRMRPDVLMQAKGIASKDLPSYLDNIVFIQLESVNGLLVSEKLTPTFLEITRKGIFFPKFYSNSVLTILSQENILCGLPTSFDTTLVKSGMDKKVLCFPEIFKKAGYKTHFMKTFSLQFSKTGKFMKNLKFDYICAEEMMKDNDPIYDWGLREDVFFKRAFDKIRESKDNKRNLIYLEIGPTNHWPFMIPDDFEGNLPYPMPKNHKERISNTTFIQDQHLKTAWEELNKTFPKGNYTLFVLSDHSWPIGIHKGNEHNERGDFEENFITPMAIVVGNNEKLKTEKVAQKYSHMDFMPTFAELLGIKIPKNNYSKSFAKLLTGQKKKSESKIILIQPFSSRSINVIQKNLKYKYNFTGKKILLYDLEKDPYENKPSMLSQSSKDNIVQIAKILPLLNSENIIMHAMGRIDGNDYTNSLEAFKFHYERGRKVFEVDFALTKDDKIVANHSHRINISQQDFLNKKITNKYTPLSLERVIDLMIEYPDMILITDTKENFSEIIFKIIELVKKKNEKLLNQIIPQVYSETTYEKAMAMYPFKAVIYTLYQGKVKDDQVIKFIKKTDNIIAVTMSKTRFSEKIAKRINRAETRVFVHTVNDASEVSAFIQKGADGIYTDEY
ncbi:MAG: sulfatase-like hydrolase/transferase [Desulfobacteraceae bacterium]|nr:sulfatase-like hydrolase/transferase [Desulfobacteraceae bacterium]